MLSNKEYLPYVEFYITHTCNFNCNGCNRFNNYAFTGHQKWSDVQEIYKKWSERLTFDDYYILGGEPMSNPDLINWIYGLKELWKDSHARITTNGSYEKKFNSEFYAALYETKTRLDIGLHNVERRDSVLKTISNFLNHPLQIIKTADLSSRDYWKNYINPIYRDFLTQSSHDPSWPSNLLSLDDWINLPDNIKNECRTRYNFDPEIEEYNSKEFSIIDDYGVMVNISLENFFHQGALIPKPESNSFTLHNSDREKAHEGCHTKHSHQFINGKLNKCGTSLLFSEFDKQFNLDLSPEDKDLIYSTPVGHVEMSDSELSEFIDNLKYSIPQCKFCPENYEFKELFSTSKKSTFGRKK